MKRTIEFKAFSKSTKKIYNVVCIDFYCENIIVNDNNEPEHSNWIDLSDFILLQYTDLRDKIDKRIFEGDVVENNDYEYGYRGVIIYENACFWIHIYGHEQAEDTLYLLDENEQIEIIGNIYTNPELLK